MRGRNEFSPLLRVVANKSHPNYVNNVKKFIELLTDGSVPRENVERYLNHYIKSDSYGNVIEYKPALYYGRMNGEYIKFLGKYGFNPNLPIITFDRSTNTFKVSVNSLGLTDEDFMKLGMVSINTMIVLIVMKILNLLEVSVPHQKHWSWCQYLNIVLKM